MRSLLVVAALGLGLISGTASAGPVIGAAPVAAADPVTTVQYRHHHRPHYHRPYYAPPRPHYRPHWHHHPRPYHRPHRPYGWR